LDAAGFGDNKKGDNKSDDKADAKGEDTPSFRAGFA